jgi:hypothetical protein
MIQDHCTAGPLSNWLNGLIGMCCDAHDLALDHTTDIGTFVMGNWDFFVCAWQLHPWLAPVVFLAVSGPVGLWLYFFGQKRKDEQSFNLTVRGSGAVDVDELARQLSARIRDGDLQDLVKAIRDDDVRSPPQ